MNEVLPRVDVPADPPPHAPATGTSPDAERLLATLAETARTRTGAHAAALWRRDGDGLVLMVPPRDPAPRLQSGQGLAGRCADARAALHVRDLDDASGGDCSDLAADERRHAPHPRTALNLPLLAANGSVLGVLQLLHPERDGFGADAVAFAELLAALGSLTLQHAGAEADAPPSNRLSDEVEVAREIQRSTLPGVMPTVAGYDFHGYYLPASYAGGDLFDLVQLPTGVFLLLGDATGHGFGPALSAIQMQGMLRVAFRLGADLDRAFLHVNNQLAEDLPEDRFISAFMGFLDPASHTINYHAAGQGPLLHFHAATGQCEWLGPDTFPVGIMALGEVKAASVIQMAPGDILAVISDGVYEQPGPGNAEFGEDRVGAIVQRDCARPMAELCRNLLDAVTRFSAGCAQADDITLVLVRRTQ